MTLLITVIVVGPTPTVYAQDDSPVSTEHYPIEPDPEIQQLIQTIMDPNVLQQKPAQWTCDELRVWHRAVRKLREKASVSETDGHIVRQIIYFHDHASGRLQSEFVWLLLLKLLFISDEHISYGILPIIEYESTELDNGAPEAIRSLKKIVSKLSSRIENDGDPSDDFTVYTNLLLTQSSNAPLPAPLIAHMYEEDPSRAITTMLDVRPPESNEIDVYLAEHVVSDVVWRLNTGHLKQGQIEEANRWLVKLSQHPDWWIRLYASEIIQQHPEFATDQLIERLSNDENELVRQAITRSDQGDEESDAE